MIGYDEYMSERDWMEVSQRELGTFVKANFLSRNQKYKKGKK